MLVSGLLLQAREGLTQTLGTLQNRAIFLISVTLSPSSSSSSTPLPLPTEDAIDAMNCSNDGVEIPPSPSPSPLLIQVAIAVSLTVFSIITFLLGMLSGAALQRKKTKKRERNDPTYLPMTGISYAKDTPSPSRDTDEESAVDHAHTAKTEEVVEVKGQEEEEEEEERMYGNIERSDAQPVPARVHTHLASTAPPTTHLGGEVKGHPQEIEGELLYVNIDNPAPLSHQQPHYVNLKKHVTDIDLQQRRQSHTHHHHSCDDLLLEGQAPLSKSKSRSMEILSQPAVTQDGRKEEEGLYEDVRHIVPSSKQPRPSDKYDYVSTSLRLEWEPRRLVAKGAKKRVTIVGDDAATRATGAGVAGGVAVAAGGGGRGVLHESLAPYDINKLMKVQKRQMSQDTPTTPTTPAPKTAAKADVAEPQPPEGLPSRTQLRKDKGRQKNTVVSATNLEMFEMDGLVEGSKVDAEATPTDSEPMGNVSSAKTKSPTSRGQQMMVWPPVSKADLEGSLKKSKVRLPASSLLSRSSSNTGSSNNNNNTLQAGQEEEEEEEEEEGREGSEVRPPLPTKKLKGKSH